MDSKISNTVLEALLETSKSLSSTKEELAVVINNTQDLKESMKEVKDTLTDLRITMESKVSKTDLERVQNTLETHMNSHIEKKSLVDSRIYLLLGGGLLAILLIILGADPGLLKKLLVTL